MDFWEMLETVPKDGTRVLFYLPPWELVDPRPEDGSMVSGWYDSVLDEYLMDGGRIIGATHWRPMPKPPRVETTPLVESAQQP